MWLLHGTSLADMQAAENSRFEPTARQVSDLAEASGDNLTVKNGVATIEVKGVLTEAPNIMAALFGGGNTTYESINNALATAEESEEVNSVVFDMNSPGGTAAGLFNTVDNVRAFSKPITTRVSGMSASAAYALASASDSITATGKADTLGSIGVAQAFYVDPEEVTVTSTNAPNKRPDVTTEEGVAAVRKQLDDIHALFVDTIAEGRGITAQKINDDFGKGGVFLAEEALERGMIDGIEARGIAKTPTASANVSGKKIEASTMNKQELHAAHPALYASIVAEGVDKERDRVGAFVVAAEMSGDTDTAMAAIKDGTEMTQTLTMQFAMAGVNRNAVAEHEADGQEADAGNVAVEEDSTAVAKASLNDILSRASALANFNDVAEV